MAPHGLPAEGGRCDGGRCEQQVAVDHWSVCAVTHIDAGSLRTITLYARLDCVDEAVAQQDAEFYLRQLDRLLPGAVVGLYLVGSVALGGYRRRRSDLDFVGVLDSAVDRQVRRSPPHCPRPKRSRDWVEGAPRGPLAADRPVERDLHP